MCHFVYVKRETEKREPENIDLLELAVYIGLMVGVSFFEIFW